MRITLYYCILKFTVMRTFSIMWDQISWNWIHLCNSCVYWRLHWRLLVLVLQRYPFRSREAPRSPTRFATLSWWCATAARRPPRPPPRSPGRAWPSVWSPHRVLPCCSPSAPSASSMWPSYWLAMVRGTPKPLPLGENSLLSYHRTPEL